MRNVSQIDRQWYIPQGCTDLRQVGSISWLQPEGLLNRKIHSQADKQTAETMRYTYKRRNICLAGWRAGWKRRSYVSFSLPFPTWYHRQRVVRLAGHPGPCPAANRRKIKWSVWNSKQSLLLRTHLDKKYKFTIVLNSDMRWIFCHKTDYDLFWHNDVTLRKVSVDSRFVVFHFLLG